MTDRELLELAAKAAGIGVRWDTWANAPMVLSDNGIDTSTWDPLTDDGDALRLAVKLQMEIAIFEDECHTRCIEHGQREWCDVIGEPYAATRRAIVRAAAEIGKAMEGGQHG